jgi:tRNA A58 N-methylase Trm61
MTSGAKYAEEGRIYFFDTRLVLKKSSWTSVRRRKTASIYHYIAEHEDLGAVFNRFMSAQSNLHNAAIVDAFDFSGVQRLIDIGGGQGATVSAVLVRYPAMKGVVFDLPEVIAKAELSPAELTERCRFAGGNMLVSVPAGGDVYLIKRVLMDSSDQEAVAVLKNCRAAMKPEGRVLIVDPMLPSGNAPHPNWLMDIHSLVVHGGMCRTEAQFSSLFESAGFALSQVVATRSPNFITEGRPQ